MTVDLTLSRPQLDGTQFDTLDALESEAIHIFREVAGEFERPVILFSGGKDSTVLLHLAIKAFWPAPLPFTLLHVDTGHNLQEVLDFRDHVVAKYNLRLHVASVEEYIADGRLTERPDGIRNPLQTVPLLDAISENRFDAVFGGARRDEERARAKERIFSLRNAFGQWDPNNFRLGGWRCGGRRRGCRALLRGTPTQALVVDQSRKISRLKGGGAGALARALVSLRPLRTLRGHASVCQGEWRLSRYGHGGFTPTEQLVAALERR